MTRTSVYISDVIMRDNWQRQPAQMSRWPYLIHDVSLVLTSKLSWLLITVRLLATIPNKKSKLLQLEQQCPLYHQACKSFGAKFLPENEKGKKDVHQHFTYICHAQQTLRIISQSTYQVNSKNNRYGSLEQLRGERSVQVKFRKCLKTTYLAAKQQHSNFLANSQMSSGL